MDNIVIAGISCTLQRKMTLFGASASYSVWPRPEPRTTDSEKCLCSIFIRITTFYRYKFSQIILLSGNVFMKMMLSKSSLTTLILLSGSNVCIMPSNYSRDVDAGSGVSVLFCPVLVGYLQSDVSPFRKS
jgi:hypothetical protein